MANQITLSNIIYKAAIPAFDYKAPFTGSITDRSELFNQPMSLKKAGYTVNVSKPVRTKSSGGIGSMDTTFSAGDWAEEETPLNINGYRKNHLNFNVLEATLELSHDQKSVVKQLVEDLAIQTEEDMLANSVYQIPNAILASGIDDKATLSDAGKIAPIMKALGCLDSDIRFLASSDTHSRIVDSSGVRFNPATAISDQYKTNLVKGMAAGMNWYESEILPIHTNGGATDGAVGADGYTPLGTVAAIPTVKTNTLAIEGTGTNGTITAGTVIRIANVNGINLRTFKTTGQVRTFAVLEDATSVAGDVTLTVSEVFDDGSDTATTQTITALPQVGAVVSYLGEVSTSYREGFAYTKPTFMKASAQIVKPYGDANDAQVKKMDNGLYLFSFFGWDNDAGANVLRADTCYGIAGGRLEWGCRLFEKIG
jgi:hypothetical protein